MALALIGHVGSHWGFCRSLLTGYLVSCLEYLESKRVKTVEETKVFMGLIR